MLNETDRPTQAGTDVAAARRSLLAGLLTAGLLLVLPQRARAQPSVSVESAELEVRDDPEPGLYLSAQFAFEPSPAIEDAVRRGIPVYFSIDFELVRTRWYWFNRTLASATLMYRLSYSPLTRQFRLSRGASIPTHREAAWAVFHERLSELSAYCRFLRSGKGAPDVLSRVQQALSRFASQVTSNK